MTETTFIGTTEAQMIRDKRIDNYLDQYNNGEISLEALEEMIQAVLMVSTTRAN